MRPKFANFKFYQKIVFISCYYSKFKILKNIKCRQRAWCCMHILSKRGAMFDIATRISRSMSILLQYFDLITATAEKPASHKYHVANGTRTRRALQPKSGNSARALTQNEMSDLGWYVVFKVRSEVRSMNYSASMDVNPEGHLHYQQKDFLSNYTSPFLQKNISQNARLEHQNANTSQSSYHTHRYYTQEEITRLRVKMRF